MTHMSRTFGAAAILVAAWVALSVAGCTTVEEIRTHHGTDTDLPVVDAADPTKGCNFGGVTQPARANSIEDYGDHWAGFVEFDDEGWHYQVPGEPSQMEVVQKRLRQELADPNFDQADFVVVAFIHGWHHNAHDDDCNVHEFRAILKVANERYAELFKRGTLAHARRIVGIYAGWRGESVNATGLRVATVIDRRNAAERVAKGDVRELFALIRRAQFEQTLRPKPRADRMRTIVIGHSFGGLVAFHGLSPALLNELTLTKPDQSLGCEPVLRRASTVLLDKTAGLTPAVGAAQVRPNTPAFPDMTVLINPAFESTRFEALHQLMRPVSGCPYPKDTPKLIVVTADNDYATGGLFTAERKFLTLLETYPSGVAAARQANEREANVHAIGFVDRYLTHRLCLTPPVPGTAQRAVAALTPPTNPDWPDSDKYAPVWVVRAPPQIVNSHDGFFYAEPDSSGKRVPYLLNWLISMHAEGPKPGSLAMTADNACPLSGVQVAP